MADYEAVESDRDPPLKIDPRQPQAASERRRSLRQRDNARHVEGEVCLARTRRRRNLRAASVEFNIADPECDIVSDRQSRCRHVKKGVGPSDGAWVDTVRSGLDC